MAISSRFNFAPGVTVNILTNGGFIFTGELIDETNVTDTTTGTTTGTNGSFLIIRLTAATAPFVAGQVVRISTNQIVALG
ncbi:hypothetical protein Dtox_0034 [Desulfofarcimen acetoxidans DSM 771]|uniref:Uncharacterized protein n=1 Tax=Desulfofarcimen acetoxidans (strain ATCC 49208 / DSM 771 / KCTC 5769 / VKM B-1644 / 5575) TaxID=485916 RepID=C8VVC2_DESAS|nr:hypothetical protein [Desulfofarcimen acetoxidans]ACV60998.1 hypothetical protein Dtox_0034 [Desulfofarcimen acetoxidans DSM 771]